MLKKESLFPFLEFGKPFHVYTDVGSRQLGVTIQQDTKPLFKY